MVNFGPKYTPFDERVAKAVAETSRLVLGRLQTKHKLVVDIKQEVTNSKGDKDAQASAKDSITLTIVFRPSENDETEREETKKYGKRGSR